jgi:hypothetical protein
MPKYFEAQTLVVMMGIVLNRVFLLKQQGSFLTSHASVHPYTLRNPG